MIEPVQFMEKNLVIILKSEGFREEEIRSVIEKLRSAAKKTGEHRYEVDPAVLVAVLGERLSRDRLVAVLNDLLGPDMAAYAFQRYATRGAAKAGREEVVDLEVST